MFSCCSLKNIRYYSSYFWKLKTFIVEFYLDKTEKQSEKGRDNVRCAYVTSVIVKGVVETAFTGCFELNPQSGWAGKSAFNTPVCRNRKVAPESSKPGRVRVYQSQPGSVEKLLKWVKYRSSSRGVPARVHRARQSPNTTGPEGDRQLKRRSTNSEKPRKCWRRNRTTWRRK